jgi:flagellar biosynthesis GTPase FlhF
VDGDRAAEGGGRFGNGGGDDNGGGRFSRPPDGGSGGSAAPINYSAAAKQPTAFSGGRVPGSEVGGTAAQVVLAKVAEDAKEKAKAEGKQQRNAAKKAAKEAEEAAKAAEKEAKKAAKKAAKEQEARDAEGAASLLKSGAKGAALATAATALGAEMPSARAVTACVLAGLSEPTSVEWCTEDEYGACLKALCSGKASTEKAVGVLIACQLHYAKLGFPKAEPKEKGQRKLPYFETLLYKLYDAEVVEEVSVNAWRYADDDDKSDEAVGKTDALFNLSEFLKWLDEPPAEEESEEEEVLEVVNVALKSK